MRWTQYMSCVLDKQLRCLCFRLSVCACVRSRLKMHLVLCLSLGFQFTKALPEPKRPQLSSQQQYNVSIVRLTLSCFEKGCPTCLSPPTPPPVTFTLLKA